jgi:hypothetical protein
MPARIRRNVSCCFEDNHTERYEPVRSVITRKTKRVIGKFASKKCNATIPWESQLERDFVYLLEVDRAVRRFFAQPERLQLVVQGEPRQYVPDFLVCGCSGASWLVEVKPDEDAALPENRAIFAAAAEACLQRNIGYRVVVRSWIRREPRLGNAKLMLRYRGLALDIERRIRVIGLLEGGPMSLAELRRALGGTQAFGEIMALLLDGTVSADLDRPISGESRLWLTGEGGRR